MAEIRPFQAIRYAPDADLAAVTCPPYDVLSEAERRALIDRSPYATARLILPEGEGDAGYANAAQLWAGWRQSGVLLSDAAPGMYVTRTTFEEPGREGAPLQRLGLISLLRLHPYADRVVLPHEHTLSRPKADRLNLLRATNANFESIMTLVEDEAGAFYGTLDAATQAAPPLLDFVAADGQRHELWKLEEPGTVASLAAFVADRPVYIADGHHRYETSVAFAEERGALGSDRPEAFLLNTLVSFADPGLVLLPTHRLVRDTPSELRTTLFRHLDDLFDVQEESLDDVLSRLRHAMRNQPTFGLILPSGNAYQVTARSASALDAAIPADVPPSLRGLDVTILQHLVLDRVLGLPASATASTERLAYTRDAEDALHRVKNAEFDLALLLGHTPVEAVRDVSQAGEVMPQKSTFFFPKLLSGLVMRDIG